MNKLLLAALSTCALLLPAVSIAAPLTLDPVGQVALGGSEIAAFDPRTARAWVTDAGNNALHVVDLSTPAAPRQIATISLAPYGAGPNSVAYSPIHGGLIAVAVEASPKTSPGAVVLFDRNGGQRAKPIRVGALPDMLTFAPGGRTLLVANEGEPNDLYTVDPEGSVTVIDFDSGLGNPNVRTARFAGVPLEGPVRIFGPGNPTAAQDLEPEYIATDGDTAWVTLQENNAIGLLDVAGAAFRTVRGLGFKDHGAAGAGIDASDRDNGTGSTLPSTAAGLADRIFPRQGVQGMYQPDAIAAFRAGSRTLLVTANEGDARVYPPADIPGGPSEGSVFSEEVRVGGLSGLGYGIGAPLLGKTGAAELGRLTVTRPSTIGVAGLTQAPPSTVSSAYSFGARSLTVWDTSGALVADTGDQLERLAYSGDGAGFTGDRANFNKSSSAGSLLDDRSDNKGPEPEGVAVGQVGETTYAFLGAERSGAIYAFDLSDPSAPAFSGYANTRTADLGPEGVSFIPSSDSPSGRPLVLIANEISKTLSVLEVTPQAP